MYMSTEMHSLCKDLLLLVGISVALLLQLCTCQQEFTTAPVPDPFRIGDFYPPRDEVEVCRPIRDYIARGSARFNNELVTNTNPLINFRDQNSRIMTSRMQSRLNSLANLFNNRFGRRITVTKAWTPFPDPELTDNSLHYEGRSIRLQVQRSGDYDDLCELAVRAAFDWVYYASSNLVRLSVIPNDCDRNVDCVFMLDQSGSVGRDNHDIAIQFIRNVVSFFNVGLDASRFGFVAYSSNAHLEFDLDDHTTLSSLDSAINRIRYRGGATATALALNATGIVLNPANTFGARPNSEGIPKIGILITDGRSNRYPLTYAAPALKNQGVQVYSVGIGNIDRNELRFISSDPDNEHVFILSSFNDAPAFVDFLRVVTCETPAIIQTCEKTTSAISDGNIQYFQVECSSFTNRVQVELQDVQGTSYLFCSASESNPGPLTSDTERDITPAVSTRTCTLDITASDNVIYVGIQGQGSSNEFSLTVWNVLFSQETVSIEVLEQTTDEVYDVSTNLLQPSTGYQYQIIGGNEQNRFRITSAGSLRVRNFATLDYNQESFYGLDIQVSNSNIDCQCGRVRVEINVVSREINFGNLPDQEIPENANINLLVSTVVVTSGGSSAVRFSITNGNVDNAFRIGENTGRIRVNRQLDFETLSSYTLTITAETTRLGIDISGTVTQTITILDINEPPYFVTECANTANGCSFSLNENEDAAYFLGTIEARDPDRSNTLNGMLSYRFQQLNIPFSINLNGRINTTQSLDREQSDSYVFTLIVMDSDISITTTVRITVNDLNDNSPEFTQAPTNVQVRENAPQSFDVAQYIATDRDAGTNGEIEYTLSSSSTVPFNLDSQTGLLTVDGSIDYEMEQMYTVDITAGNPGSTQKDSVRVQIEILNLNDNTPQFSQDSYTADVMEHSATEELITTVSATDDDLNDHNIVRYQIVDGNINNLLSINAMNGEIRVAGDIDREQITAFTLTIEARDNGSPQTRQSRVQVMITVIDINDNAPVFSPDTHSLVLREDIQPIFNVVQLFASDADEPGNPNSMIVYSIQSSTGIDANVTFQLNPSSGQLLLVQSLDFESEDSYQFQILATDQGSPPLSDTATVTIAVTNVNEDPPMLSGDQAVEISELAAVGTNVAVFNALDPDNMPVTFSISSGNEEAKFEIGRTSGTITLAASLDFETTTEYTLGILASDGSQDASVSLTVSVLDENEFTPEFTRDTSFEIDEEEPSGVLVGTLMATDGDAGLNNSRITFSFVQQTQFTNLFNLDPDSGRITTTSVLDRENLLQIFPPDTSQHSVQVSARDGGIPSLQSVTTITIRLVDVNDNAPMFSDQSYLNSILENLPAGQSVFQLGATDVDLGSNSQIEFSFSLTSNSGNTVPFEIDENTGFIQTTQPLDCELQANYSFTLTATDMGTPSMSSEIQGTLTIIDENDNAPMFTMDVYRVTVNETVDIGRTILLQVTANDPDKGSNGEVLYSVINTEVPMNSLESQDDGITLFTIDLSNGNLRHITAFNFEATDEVTVTVVAKDRGIPILSGSAQVIFTVLNVDETPPDFVGTCDATVNEDVQDGTFVTQCFAVDPDNITTSENQVAITYSIFSGNSEGKFMIEENTGIIRTADSLNAEEETSYTLMIEATDLAGRSEFSRDVTITVLDINDNAPQFASQSYEFTLSDSVINRYQQEIIIVAATDADSGDNGMFTFSIGTVTSNIEEMKTTVEIVVTDHGSPSLSTTSILTVSFESQCLLQEYEVVQSSTDASRGTVSVYVLCQIELRPNQLEVPLRSSSGIFYCTVVRNSPMTYQWLHNGSAITASNELTRGRPEVSYTIQNAQFEDAGEYACKASTRVGSLQTINGVVNIQVPPTIIIPPEDVAVKTGGIATFTCSVAGTPTPIIEWLIGEQVVATGSPLVIDDIDKPNEGSYVCRASSTAGVATAEGRLTLYVNTDVVEIDFEAVNNPNEDGTCHIVDVNAIEAVLNSITSRRAMITNIQGVDICELTACTPNPCMNGGKCELTDNIMGGYMCTCAEGFTGRNCTEDVDECINDPCGSSGNCTNERGRYRCQCSRGTSGHRCQFSDVCKTTPDICSDGEICLESFSSGFLCRPLPDASRSVVVRGVVGDPGFLGDLLQMLIEQQLALVPQNRQKRQTDDSASTLLTLCESRFYDIGDGFILLWICPGNETEPSTDEEMNFICNFLLEQKAVQTCTPPNGEEMVQPTVPTLPDVNIKLGVLLIDSNTNVPLDGLESTKILVDSGAQNELTDSTGVTVVGINAQVTGPRTQPPSAVDTGNSAGAIAGGVIAGLLVVALLVAGGFVLVIFGSKKYSDHNKRQTEKKKYALQMASMASNISLAERGAQLERENSLNQLIDDGGDGNDYDSLPPRKSPDTTQETAMTIFENTTKKEE